MSDGNKRVSRRTTLKQVGIATGAGALGVAAGTGQVTAQADSTDLSVVSVGTTDVTLTWNDVGARTHYLYWKNRDTGNTAYTTTQSTEKTLSLQSGTEYLIYLGVVNDRTIEWKRPVTAVTDAEDGGGDDDATDDGSDSDTSSFVSSVEAKIHEKINERRANNDLSSLSYRDDMATVARDHSQYQADQGELSHVQNDGDTVGDRLEQDGITCRSWAENVLYNYSADDSAEAAAEKSVEQWMNSSGHRDNILGDYAVEGVGVVTTSSGRLYATQVFGSDCN